MATVERTFHIDETIAKNLDKMISRDKQSQFINDLLFKNIYNQDIEKLNNLIKNFRFKYPKNEGISSTDLLRQIRDGELR
ncbi:hypothetical protein ACGTJS_02735 [Faucicola mancuniensis]|uniref:hypothetical protein n=1 Tax=Faucicola mancuniensis TaxID=1309795 RepID=UPI0028EF9954|nr:hypothetical protein [uncultured Moraxella sp.]